MKPEYEKDGNGPPFIYVSGLEGSGKLFYKQARDLARDHTVVTFPLRPHGRYTMSDLINDLVWIVRDVGAEPATFLGESFGGLVVLAAAYAHPEIFERMILVNTFPFFTQRAKINLGVWLYSLLPYGLIKGYRTATAPRVLFSADIGTEDRLAFREHTRQVPFEGYVSRLRIIRDTDLRTALPTIQVPALVVAGTADRLIKSVGAASLIASSLPRAKLKLLEGTGHMALLSGGVRVREWLTEFTDI